LQNFKKQAKRRQQQMSGFQGGGRPASAAGRRRPNSAAQRSTGIPPVDSAPGLSPKNGRSSGIANPAFDEPEITEVLSNDNQKKETSKTVN
jgi:hypothetical protein